MNVFFKFANSFFPIRQPFHPSIQQQVTINFNKLHADPKQGKTLDIGTFSIFFIHQFIHPSIHSSIHPSIYPLIYSSIHPSIIILYFYLLFTLFIFFTTVYQKLIASLCVYVLTSELTSIQIFYRFNILIYIKNVFKILLFSILNIYIYYLNIYSKHQYILTLLINKLIILLVLKKFKHKMAENMSANTADSFGMSRAILCNGRLYCFFFLKL